MKRGDELQLTINRFSDRGKPIASFEERDFTIEGAVPGDRVRARVLRKRRKRVDMQLLEVIEPSVLRTQPRCRYFGTCGGCKWQHVSYKAQCEAKRKHVENALQHHGGFAEIEVRPTLKSERVYFYRNKMEFSFSADRWLTTEEIDSGKDFDTSFALGLHAPGYYNKVIDLHECHLQSDLSIRLVNAIRTLAQNLKWDPWDIRNHVGYLRHLVIRQGEFSSETMVNLVMSEHHPDREEIFGTFIQTHFPEVTTVVCTINSGVAQIASGESSYTIFGPGVIRDCIGRFEFEIAPNAFFQTNTRQAERLYAVVREFAELKPQDLVYDLYCGAGTISLYIAEEVDRVIGIEVVDEAVQNARINAARNHIPNCTFISGDLLRIFDSDLIATYGSPNVLIADPPRAGIHKKVVEQIARLKPERFVYVSCNPETQARDLALLRDLYVIEAVQPVDLFPHTPHVENVIKLRARKQA